MLWLDERAKLLRTEKRRRCGPGCLPIVFGVPDGRPTWRVGDLAADHVLMLKHGLEVLELGVVLHLLTNVVVLVEKRELVVPGSNKQVMERGR